MDRFLEIENHSTAGVRQKYAPRFRVQSIPDMWEFFYVPESKWLMGWGTSLSVRSLALLFPRGPLGVAAPSRNSFVCLKF